MSEAPLNVVKQEDVDASFVSSIEDTIDILKKMAPHYDTVDEAIETLEHALINSGARRLLMDRILKRRK